MMYCACNNDNDEGAGTMNVQLGRGKVHYAGEADGFAPTPQCGGNRGAEGYRAVTAEVDCKNCLKIMAAEAAKAEAATPEDTTYSAALEDARAMGYDYAEAVEYAEDAVKTAERRKQEAAYDALFYAEDGHTLAEGICGQCKDSADNNADDTAREEGFVARTSARWFEVAVHTYASAHDDHTTEENRAAYFRESDRECLAEGARNAYNVAFDKCRSLNWSEADAHEYAMQIARAQEDAAAVRAQAAAEARAEEKGEEMTNTIQGPVYALVGEELHAAFNGEKSALCGKGEIRPVPKSMANSVETAPMCVDCATLSDAWHTNNNEKETEMPPRAKKTAAPKAAPAEAPQAEAAPKDVTETILDVKDMTARIANLVEAGTDTTLAASLSEEAETLIRSLPTEHRTELRAALESAKRGEALDAADGKKAAPAKKATKAVAKKTARATVQSAASRESQDYKQAIPDAAKVVADISATLAAGVKHEIDNATSTRAVAEKILHARLHLTDKDGHPDFHGKSHAAKQITTDILTGAGSSIERNEESEDALDRLLKSVQNLRNDVLVKYVRNITKEDAEKFFPLALKANPDADPAKAIQTFYKIPEKSTFEIQAEKRRLERQARKALDAGDEKRAKELEAAAKTVGKPEVEGGEGEGETAAATAPTTAAEKRKVKHLGAVETAAEKLGGIEADLDKIGKEEAAELVAKLEAFSGMTATLTAMLKAKIS